MNSKLHYGTPEEAGMDPARIAHVRDLARGWVEQGITPSLVVLAARRGVIVLHEAFGVMGPEPEAGPLQKDSIFPLASLTKPITATAVMCLVEDGLLGLNRPVQWYIPEFVGEGKDAVMVHHLMTHTSGLTDGCMTAHAEAKRGAVVIPPAQPTEHPRVHEEYCLRYDAPLSRPPGEEMSYCTWGYEFLGEIVRRVSGQSLEVFTREQIFEPLGMGDTHWIVPESESPRVVRRADDSPGAHDAVAWHFGETPWASAGAHATVSDTAVFAQTLLNGGEYGEVRLLSRPSVAAMTQNQIPGISAWHNDEYFAEATWGFGWNTHGDKKGVGTAETLQSPESYCHGGGGGVLLWVDPAQDIVGAYFSVVSDRGTPEGVQVPDGALWHQMTRIDYFVNSVTAAITD